MPTVADALRRHAPAYLSKFGDPHEKTSGMPLTHRKVLHAITRCRTGELGGVVYQCDDCGQQHWVGRSCGNRHCPTCQVEKTKAWLDKQSQRLLPVHHFLVTFTVPEPIRRVLRSRQREGYRALFSAGSATIQDVGRSTKSLRDCQLGFFGVLHTWGRDPMVYHPHVHFVVPGGGVSQDHACWQATPENFLFPHAVMTRVYKAKLADQLRACGLYDQVPVEAWSKKFVVDIQPVGDGQAVLKYLAPYVYRVAISDKRIVACDERSVTFRYTPSKSKRSKTRTVSGEEFVRGFLQHVLPTSFQKVRYYGWQSSNCRLSWEAVKWLVWLFLGWTFWLGSGYAPQEEPPAESTLACPLCGGVLRRVEIVNTNCRALVEYSLAYLDSG